jgi:hypothetical protein
MSPTPHNPHPPSQTPARAERVNPAFSASKPLSWRTSGAAGQHELTELRFAIRRAFSWLFSWSRCSAYSPWSNYRSAVSQHRRARHLDLLSWRAAAPTEIIELEPGACWLRHAVAECIRQPGSAFINLQFAVGTDMQATMLEVISRMNQAALPRDAGAASARRRRQRRTTRCPGSSVTLPAPGPITNYRRQIEELRSRIESIPVSPTCASTSRRRRAADRVRPARAELGIQIAHRAGAGADDVSGGFVDITAGRPPCAGNIRRAILRLVINGARAGRWLGDVATVQNGAAAITNRRSASRS